MNRKTDNNLITGAFVIKASDDDGLIHQSQYQGFTDSARNKRFFLLRNGKDDRIQSDVTAIALSAPIIGLSHAKAAIDAIAIVADGRFIMSTIGTIDRFILPAVFGEDEDWLTFTSTTPTAIGVNTKQYRLYFDSSDKGLNNANSKDINGVGIDSHGGI
ncbi:hypothetical protein NIES22_61100 [Calothrix brevissima NIES-22]|nr:hypothetical protein NIES22_61100 [Calothrix brevissima NIES-22]